MLVQFLFSIILFAALVVTWRRRRQAAMRTLEAVGWSAAWITALVVVWHPDLSTRAANLVGVGRGSDLVLYGSVIILFLLVFRLYAAAERIERGLTELVRQEALQATANNQQLTTNNQDADIPKRVVSC